MTPKKNHLAGKFSLFVWPGYILFFFLVYLPVTTNESKGWLTAIVVGIILLNYLFWGRGLRIHGKVLSLTLCYAALGLLYVVYGFVRGAPGALFSSLVYVVFPLLYVLFIAVEPRGRRRAAAGSISLCATADPRSADGPWIRGKHRQREHEIWLTRPQRVPSCSPAV